MATEKKKVLTIETGNSEKNVKSLKQQMKELKEQMAQLTKGTDEYNKASKNLADLNQKQIEINEAMKYSNRDIGATLNNLKNITVGVAAGFNGISASLQLLGIASDESGEALKNIQLMMAVIQSVGAIDTALKSLNGLANAFGFLKKSSNEVTDDLKKAQSGIDSLNTAKKGLGGSTNMSAGAELAEASALTQNTAKMKENNDEAERYNEANKTNTETTKESTEAIYEEIDAMRARKSALEGDLDIAQRVQKRFEDDIKRQQEYTKTVTDEAKKRIIARKQESVEFFKQDGSAENVADAERSLERWKNETSSAEIITQDFADTLNELGYLFGHTTDPIGRYGDEIEKLKTRLLELTQASLTLQEDVIPELQIDLEETANDIQGMFANSNVADEVNESIQGLKDGFESILDGETQLAQGLMKTKEQVQTLTNELGELEKAEQKTTKEIDKNTKAVKNNEKATKAGAKGWGIFGKAGATAWKTIKTAMIATGIGAIIALVTEGIMKLIDLLKTVDLNGFGKDYKMIQDVEKQASQNYAEQSGKLQILQKTLEDNTETLADRKKALEEIKKIVPEYLGQLDEEGRLTNSNTEAIENYLIKLQEKLKYQAYEQKYIELLQEEVEKEQAIKEYQDGNWWFKLWHSKTGRVKEHNEVLRQQTVILQKIKELNLDIALTEPTKKTGGGGGTTAQLKLWVDYLKEIRSLLQNIWGTYFDNLDLNIDFFNFDPTKAFRATINRILKTGSDVSGMFTDWFDNALKKGINGIKASDLKLNGIFKKDDLQEYYDKVWEQIEVYKKLLAEGEERAKNNKNMTSAQTKQWEKEKKQYEDTLAKLKAESKAIIDITKATESYIKNQDELYNKTVELQKAEAEYRKGLAIEAQYRKEAREGNIDADANRQIANAKMQLALTENLRITDEARYESLKQIKNKTKAQYEEEIELQKKVLENEKFVTEQEAIIEDANYTKRTNRMKQFYEEADRYAELFATRNANSKTAKGWGTADYNVNMDALIAQLNAMKQKMDELNEQQDMDAVEKANRMIELQQQTADLELQIETEKVNRKIAINQTYYNALSQMASGVQGILQAEMDKYDENSEQYRKLAVANAWIDTISGTLSAFMSGMQSGIPAPYNAVLATALAGMTFYAGQQQIRALESGTKGSAMNVQMPTTTYETLAYENQTELLGKIKDTKVYVTESDITSTQRKVAVRESNARF